MKKKLLVLVASGLAVPVVASAEWTPLITATMFDGVRADVILAASGIFLIGLIIFGINVLMRTVR